MPWTTHGHWYGEPNNGDRGAAPTLVTQCGGPHVCAQCAREALAERPDPGLSSPPGSVGGIVTTTRAKFQCVTETRNSYNVEAGVRSYRFQAMYDSDLPEDQRYAKYTPTGSLEITVDNPNVQFELGQQYYLDIIPVEASA